jgi:hypothetical protein
MRVLAMKKANIEISQCKTPTAMTLGNMRAKGVQSLLGLSM